MAHSISSVETATIFFSENCKKSKVSIQDSYLRVMPICVTAFPPYDAFLQFAFLPTVAPRPTDIVCSAGVFFGRPVLNLVLSRHFDFLKRRVLGGVIVSALSCLSARSRPQIRLLCRLLRTPLVDC